VRSKDSRKQPRRFASRLKSDKSIISDLPDKIENDQLCSLTKEQAAVYENTVKAALKTIEGAEENFARQGLVLQMILASNKSAITRRNISKKARTRRNSRAKQS
jgi:SNF2 family DNA or RNA helicase